MYYTVRNKELGILLSQLVVKPIRVCQNKKAPFHFVCQTSIEDWTKTPWKEINVEQMDMELRRFAKV